MYNTLRQTILKAKIVIKHSHCMIKATPKHGYKPI